MIRISLIIPFFGVERFIRECLDSVFCQDIPESEYEVICVNDCSPDNSESIVQEFQDKHRNLHLLRHETNKKLGAARNTGLQHAIGEYVWFIDSDDYIKPNCLRQILRYCEDNDLDILHWAILDNYNKWILQVEESPVHSGVEDLLHGSRDMTFPWNRVYRRAFLIDNNLWFNDLWGGDVIHTIYSLNAAERIKNISDCYYFYRVDNMSSDMHSGITANKIVSFCYVLAKALDESTDSLNPSLLPLMRECVEWRINQSFKPILRLSFKERLAFYHTMKSDMALRNYILDTADWKVKMALRFPLLTFLSTFPYRILRQIRK